MTPECKYELLKVVLLARDRSGERQIMWRALVVVYALENIVLHEVTTDRSNSYVGWGWRIY